MPIRIVAVGRKHESWIVEGIERYQKRLKKPYDIEWVVLAHSTQDGLVARREDSQHILSRLNANDYVVLLDEKGQAIDSPKLSAIIQQQFQVAQNVVFVIGGSYGVDDSVHRRANFVWSLSPLVFPHQLVRTILVEQIYRAQEIAAGKPYHHD
jgi:23S rRNA (pseudouridine1915-N3)-methyltransferase